MDFNKTRYIPMSRRRRIYEGKAKVLYEGPEPETEQEPGLMATYPIGRSSTIDPAVLA